MWFVRGCGCVVVRNTERIKRTEIDFCLLSVTEKHPPWLYASVLRSVYLV